MEEKCSVGRSNEKSTAEAAKESMFVMQKSGRKYIFNSF
jgi:hypothetical protein